MADIVAALDEALRARYMPREIRRPITHRQGLKARLNGLQKVYGTAAKLAAALGVNPRTIRKWRSGETKVSAANLRKIERNHNRLISLPRMRDRLKNSPPPNSVQVSAIVNWNGYISSRNRGQRTVILGGMRAVMARTIRTWATAGPEAAAAVFQRGAATVNHVPNTDVPGIQFQGEDVTVSIPWENP